MNVILYYYFVFQVILAFGIVVVGGTVEGYGYGLSLGTKWPYTKDMPLKAKAGDPEVWHRILATLLGVDAVIMVVLIHGTLEITGLILVVLTALLGMATLYTLAGKAPSVVQGLHDILAYSTALTYLLIIYPVAGNVLELVIHNIPLYFFFAVIYMGGMTTGERGYQKAIGYFKIPKTRAQWIWTIHGLAVLLFLFTLILFFFTYNVALIIIGVQIIVGIIVFISVNKSASKPGFIIPMHQFFTILIVLSIVFQLSIFK